MASFWCLQCGQIKPKDTKYQRICNNCRVRNENYRRLLTQQWRDYKQDKLEHGRMVLCGK
jgi:hypothetical protein